VTSAERFLAEHAPRFEEIRETYLDYGPLLPTRYGPPLVRLLVRDPEGIYAYWEGGTTLRVLDRTRGSEMRMDILEVGSGFLAAEPEHEYEAEIGREESGHFAAVARSNRVRTPRRGPALEVDAEWAPTSKEWEQLRALSALLAMPLPSSPKA